MVKWLDKRENPFAAFINGRPQQLVKSWLELRFLNVGIFGASILITLTASPYTILSYHAADFISCPFRN
jgi:hypothetical protein